MRILLLIELPLFPFFIYLSSHVLDIIIHNSIMRFILWGTLAALLAFNVYSEGTPEDTQDNEQD